MSSAGAAFQMVTYSMPDIINDPPNPPYTWQEQKFARVPKLGEIKTCDRCPDGGTKIVMGLSMASCGCGKALAHWDGWLTGAKQGVFPRPLQSDP